VTFATDLDAAVRRAKEAAGGRYVNVLGADVARQCVDAGLLDEVLVFVAPVLLGEGTPLFARPGGGRVRLEPLRPGDVGPARLWFRVVR
jgi:dihydrofolate reductase